MDANIQTLLRAQYNPDGSKIRNLQMEMLEVLIAFDQFCRGHDIQFTISGGTMLGAVRHHGFIPWDDDLDMMITRENFEKLWSFRDEHEKINDSIYLWNTRSVPMVSLGKQFLDLSIIDNIPDNKFLRQMKRLCAIILVLLIKAKNVLLNGRYKVVFKSWFILIPIAACFKRSTLQRWLQQGVCLWGNKKFSKNKGTYTNLPKDIGKPLPREAFEKYIDLEFEGHKVMCISEYNTFLRRYYGDYMQLPKHVMVHGRLNN